MLALLERLLVAAIVAAAFLYAVWALMPAGTRRALAQRLVVATGGPESATWSARLAQRLAQAAGGGSHCHGCEEHAAKPGTRPDSRP